MTEQHTKLVNVQVYDEEDDITMIDRRTRFGNPYVLKKYGGYYTRAESIKEYEKWFKQKIQDHESFKQAVHQLRGKTLGCHCKPLDCHGDVIIEYLNETQ